MRNFLKGQTQKTFLALVFLVVTLFVLEKIAVMSSLEGSVQKTLRPVQLGFYKTGQDFSNFAATIGGIGKLRQRENDLSLENAELLAENARLKGLEKENKLLRDQLGAKIVTKNVIAANVIGTSPLFSSSEFLLDKGKSDGVRENALVVLKDILIGQIKTTSDSTSVVRLLTDPESKIPAVTEGGAEGILDGEFGSGLALDQVAQTDTLQEGQIVFTLGEAGFPRGLVLGKIKKVEKNPAEIFQKAIVEPLVSFGSLNLVFVGR